jgi:hypothetical protein
MLKKGLSSKNIILTLCLIVYLALGLRLFPSYGIHWDDPVHRTIGGVTYRFLGDSIGKQSSDPQVLGMPKLSEFAAKDYGVLFETPAFAIERLLNLNDSRDQFLLRHLLTFLCSLIGIIAIYLLASRRYQNWQLGLLAAIFLVISPRFFADSFYNTKDLVFMAIFTMSVNTMLLFAQRHNKKIAFLHGLITAFAVDVRILGILIFAGTLLLLAFQIIKKEANVRKIAIPLLIYICTTIIFVIACFPYLWEDPFKFFKVFSTMARFPWNHEVLYFGEFIRATNLPWHYIPAWIGITTPIFYLFLFIFGASVTLAIIFKNRFKLWSNDKEMQDVVFLAIFILPIAIVITLNSVLYDGWRHLYFIYPAFLLVCLRGFVFLRDHFFTKKIAQVIFYLLTCCILGYYAYWIRANHPYQSTFFNIFAGNEKQYRFDMDYWGVGNRRALEKLLEIDHRSQIKIFPVSYTQLDYSFMVLSEDVRYRISLANSEDDADYILTNYRNVPFSKDQQLLANYPVYLQVKVDSEPIITIYKVK